MADAQDSGSDTNYEDLLGNIVNTGVDIFKTKTGLDVAKQGTQAANATAAGSILSSRNIMIGGALIAVAIIAFVIFRRK